MAATPVRRTRRIAKSRQKKTSSTKLSLGSRLELWSVGLFGLGLYMAALLYFDLGGGALGDPLQLGLFLLLGVLAYLLPVALGVLAIRMAFHHVLFETRAFRGGLLALTASLLLWFGGGYPPLTLPTGSVFDEPYFIGAGGFIGSLLYSPVFILIGRLGVGILAGTLFTGALILLTGLSLRALMQHGSRQARSAAGLTRAGSESLQRALTDRWNGGIEEHTDTLESKTPALRLLSFKKSDKPPTDGAMAFPDIFPLEKEEAPPSLPPQSDFTPFDTGMEERLEETTPRLFELAKNEQQGKRDDEVPEQPYVLPSPHLLKRGRGSEGPSNGYDEKVAKNLVATLAHFGVQAQVIGSVSGPRLTRYELSLAPGTKVSRVSSLKDDLAYALASTDIRILAPIPGKSAVGVEVPNPNPNLVTLGDIYRELPAAAGPLVVWLGKDISGKSIYTDLTKMPHLLIAGTTGAGKSGCLNAMLSSILLRTRPDEVKLILIDPKRVELNHYESIPHLLTPVVTNMKKAANALANIVREMERRYEVMQLVRARSLPELNRIRTKRGEEALPYILLVIDELADLMMISPATVEDAVIRLAQKARAVGIHLVVATQRPSVDVITGMIKANIPSRIAFAVSSQIDSRVILDTSGAEALLGQGDMLFRPIGTHGLQRIQGAYITEEEIKRLTDHCRKQGHPELREEILEDAPPLDSQNGKDDDESSPDQDDLLAAAIETVVLSGSASVSLLQRRLRVGYTRAGRLIDMLERRGIISGYEGSKPRAVLISEAQLPHVLETHTSPSKASHPAEISVPFS